MTADQEFAAYDQKYRKEVHQSTHTRSYLHTRIHMNPLVRAQRVFLMLIALSFMITDDTVMLRVQNSEQIINWSQTASALILRVPSIRWGSRCVWTAWI
jgi:hypothetical protein